MLVDYIKWSVYFVLFVVSRRFANKTCSYTSRLQNTASINPLPAVGEISRHQPCCVNIVAVGEKSRHYPCLAIIATADQLRLAAHNKYGELWQNTNGIGEIWISPIPACVPCKMSKEKHELWALIQARHRRKRCLAGNLRCAPPAKLIVDAVDHVLPFFCTRSIAFFPWHFLAKLIWS